MTSTTRTASPDLHRSADVVIVGGRCAGAATALLLARAGLRVTVLERAAAGSDTLSTHALMRTAVLQLQRWGLLDEIRRGGAPPLRRTTFHYGAEEVVLDLKPSAGVDALYAPRRTLLDVALVQAAQAAGADVRFGAAALGLRRDDAGTVTGVHARLADGRVAEVQAPLTIGADGVTSSVARWAGAGVERVGRHAGALLYAYLPLEDAGYGWWYAPGSTAGVIPTNGGVACVFVGTTPERLRALLVDGAPAAFQALAAAASPDLAARVAAAGPPRGLRRDPGRPGFLRRPSGPGWLLVGDAGHHRDPLGTRGISDALRDAELAARAVLDGLGGGDLGTALAAFGQQRDTLVAPVFATIDELASYRWDLTTVPSLLRRMAAETAAEVDLLAALGPLPAGVGAAVG